MHRYKAEPELPAEVVYFNEWTDFRNADIRKLFEPIAPQKLARLTPGSIVWIDTEQPSGKVYGYQRAEIVSLREDGMYVRPELKHPWSDRTHVHPVRKRGGWHKIHGCRDDRKLAALVKEFPLSTETGTVSTISEASRAHLRTQGKVVVNRTP